MVLRATLLLVIPLAAANACETAADCAYAGECNGGRCVCNAHWSGPNCTTLRLLPSPTTDAAGLRRKSSSSWGGSVIWDAERERWVMLFSDMEGHCGLNAWKRNSRICMATSANSSSPVGPFAMNNSSSSSSSSSAVVLPSWAHNPTVHGPILTPPAGYEQATGNSSSTSAVYLIYHIGTGHGGIYGKPRTDCTNGTTPSSRDGDAATDGATAAVQPRAVGGPIPPPPFVLPRAVTPNLLVASSVNGPWAPHRWGKLGWGCNNPGAAVLKNGTVVLACKVMLHRGPDGGLPWRQMAIYVAPSWRGPYELRRLTPVYGEDAYVWHDPAADGGTGAFHMLLHAMRPTKVPTTAWSKDGLEWIANGYAGPPHPQPRASFNHSIALAGGGLVELQRRERHQPIFRDGKLVGLCNGVTTGVDDDYSFTACVPVAT